jgi:hypothetical protein
VQQSADEIEIEREERWGRTDPSGYEGDRAENEAARREGRHIRVNALAQPQRGR